MIENIQLATARQFREILNTYLKYQEESRPDPEVVCVSFLCMTGGQKNEMAEMKGLVAL